MVQSLGVETSGQTVGVSAKSGSTHGFGNLVRQLGPAYRQAREADTAAISGTKAGHGWRRRGRRGRTAQTNGTGLRTYIIVILTAHRSQGDSGRTDRLLHPVLGALPWGRGIVSPWGRGIVSSC